VFFEWWVGAWHSKPQGSVYVSGCFMFLETTACCTPISRRRWCILLFNLGGIPHNTQDTGSLRPLPTKALVQSFCHKVHTASLRRMSGRWMCGTHFPTSGKFRPIRFYWLVVSTYGLGKTHQPSHKLVSTSTYSDPHQACIFFCLSQEYNSFFLTLSC